LRPFDVGLRQQPLSNARPLIAHHSRRHRPGQRIRLAPAVRARCCNRPLPYRDSPNFPGRLRYRRSWRAPGMKPTRFPARGGWSGRPGPIEFCRQAAI
jgi:hypothetical protein